MRKKIVLCIVFLFTICLHGEIRGKKVRLEGTPKEGEKIMLPIEGICELYTKGIKVRIDEQTIYLYLLKDYRLFEFENGEWQLFISKELLKKELDQIPLSAFSIECRNKIHEKFGLGKILVLKVAGIPTMVEKLPGNLGTKTFCEIKINGKGDWKAKSILGDKSDSTNVLEKGEILIITSFKIDWENIEIITRTERSLPYDASGRITWLGSHLAKGTGPHANLFDISHEDGCGCEDALKILEKYFDVYNSRDEINKPKEIKIGMSVEDIEKILGKPQKIADMGIKIVYLFSDTIVTFEDGKVANIEFR